jgi:hypothetical protein
MQFADTIEALEAHKRDCAMTDRSFVFAPVRRSVGEGIGETRLAPVEIVDRIGDTLAERGSRYGDSRKQAKISVALKTVLRMFPGWRRLTPHMQWALDFIADKIARILNGDPTYPDNWHDIAGYATLVERELS